MPVVFAEDGSEPLLGAVTLEIFLLAVDSVRQRLIPVRGLLMPLLGTVFQPNSLKYIEYEFMLSAAKEQVHGHDC